MYILSTKVMFIIVFFFFSSPLLPFPLMHALRYHCGVPVIIEGETGVGKTALVEMLSKLWNYALVVQWKRRCGQLLDTMKSKLKDISPDVSDNYQVCHNLCGTIPSILSKKSSLLSSFLPLLFLSFIPPLGV